MAVSNHETIAGEAIDDSAAQSSTIKIKRARSISIFLFTLGFCALLSSGSFGDFYLEINSRYLGKPIASSYAIEFCGYTYGKYPDESELAYSWRAFWNMFLAKLAVAVSLTVVFSVLIALVIYLFKLFGVL